MRGRDGNRSGLGGVTAKRKRWKVIEWKTGKKEVGRGFVYCLLILLLLQTKALNGKCKVLPEPNTTDRTDRC